MQTNQEQPSDNTPAEDRGRRDAPPGSGRGADSALQRMKQLERSRAKLRTTDSDKPADRSGE